jgi:hypothetical protein
MCVCTGGKARLPRSWIQNGAHKIDNLNAETSIATPSTVAVAMTPQLFFTIPCFRLSRPLAQKNYFKMAL